MSAGQKQSRFFCPASGSYGSFERQKAPRKNKFKQVRMFFRPVCTIFVANLSTKKIAVCHAVADGYHTCKLINDMQEIEEMF